MINELISEVKAEYTIETESELRSFKKKILDLRKAGRIKYPELPSYSDDLIHGTINSFDAEVLYFLIRKFKPKIVFEIGTWVGTSAMVMAEAIRRNDNGGKIYTCDINNYFLLGEEYSDIITAITEYSDVAIDKIPAEEKIDFVFTDGELTFKTLRNLIERLNPDALIVTHDFVLPAEKGVLNFVRTQIVSKCSYNLVANTNKNIDYESGSTIALFAKNDLLKSVDIKVQSFSNKLFTTMGYAFGAFFAKISKKLFRLTHKLHD